MGRGGMGWIRLAIAASRLPRLGHCGARLLHPNEGVHDEAARPIRLQNIDDLDPA